MPFPPVLTVLLAVLVVAMLPFSAWGVWHGWSTIQADRRMQVAGLTAEARVVRLSPPRRGTVSTPTAVQPGYVGYELVGQPGQARSISVDTGFWTALRVGQRITLRIDPANPDRHSLDRGHEQRMAWVFVAGFGVLLALSAGLAVWMLRGGLSGGARSA